MGDLLNTGSLKRLKQLVDKAKLGVSLTHPRGSTALVESSLAAQSGEEEARVVILGIGV